jgi:hypothetical protein
MLGIPTPTEEDVVSWADQQESKILAIVPESYAQQRKTLKHLESTLHDVLNKGTLPDGPTFHAWQYTAPLAHYRASQVDNPEAKVIALDLDGCLYDFNSAMREWFVSQGLDRERFPEPNVYSLKEAWDVDHEMLVREMILAVRAGQMWNTGYQMDDGLSGARSIGLAGHVLSVVSARRLNGVEELANRTTTQWLRGNNIHVDKLMLVSPSDPAAKLSIHFDLLIDDHPGNVEVAISAGRKAILLDRAWNRTGNTLPRATYPEIVDNLDYFLNT